jgi:hypothetical protein
MRVVWTRDLIHWDPRPLNPVRRVSDDDRRIANPKLPWELCRRIATATNLNNSDIDFCEEGGQLLMNYSWGNQQGAEFLAEATFSRTEKQFLRGWFPTPPKGSWRLLPANRHAGGCRQWLRAKHTQLTICPGPLDPSAPPALQGETERRVARANQAMHIGDPLVFSQT